MRNPRFTIITCTFNSEKYLPETLKSVESQDFKNYEHIFIDGFSNDNTVKIIKQYSKGKKNVKFYQLKPKGISNAMNEGIKRANGKYIHILHSDDFFLSTKALSTADEFIGKTGSKWFVGKSKELINGKYVSTRFYYKGRNHYKKLLPLRVNLPHENVFLAKEVFDKFGLFKEDYKITMDYELWLRIIRDVKLCFIDFSFATFRYHKSSASSSGENTKREEYETRKAFNTYYRNRIFSKIILELIIKYTHLKRYILRKRFGVQR